MQFGTKDLKRTTPDKKTLSRSQERRREDIIQAALEIFDRDGFDAAKMADIAKEAGVAKGTLYLYFDTKIELLEGVVLTVIMPTLQKIGEVAETKAGSASELLKQQLRIAALRMASPEMKTLLRHMISGGPQHQGIIKLYYDNVVQRGLEHFKSTLDFGVETGEFRKEIKDIDPLILVGAHIYTAVWNILFGDLEDLDVDKLVNDHFELIQFGLLAN